MHRSSAASCALWRCLYPDWTHRTETNTAVQCPSVVSCPQPAVQQFACSRTSLSELPLTSRRWPSLQALLHSIEQPVHSRKCFSYVRARCTTSTCQNQVSLMIKNTTGTNCAAPWASMRAFASRCPRRMSATKSFNSAIASPWTAQVRV